MSKSEAQRRTGPSQLVSWLAVALPADPSRAVPPVRIHHHGKEARTVVTLASMLRRVSFIIPLMGAPRSKIQISRQVQKPTMKMADSQVMTMLSLFPRRWT